MTHLTKEQIRRFRLHAHHLDTWYEKADVCQISGACGLQNSPPGAWETALHNRIHALTKEHLRQLLEEDKTLLQAWSFRGAPVVFPASERDVFLSALVPVPGEPWIYTQGIELALDFLNMSFDELLALLLQVMPKLKGQIIKSKVALDQTLADWVLPLLPQDRRLLWTAPSMYGNPEKQTVGGAAVSFLLRPCALMGHIVFGKREGAFPTFTDAQSWLNQPASPRADCEKQLVRNYLHCYGPASVGSFASWLGCSFAQAKRLWHGVEDEMESVCFDGKERFFLSVDKKALLCPPEPRRTLHLLGGHDPYLGLGDRDVILADKGWQKKLWQTVSNPGAVLWMGEIVGMWKPKKKGAKLEIEVTLRPGAAAPEQGLAELAERYALFTKATLEKLVFLP